MLKIDLVAQLEYMTRARLDHHGAPLAAALVRTLYAHVPPGDLITARPEMLCGAALALLDFAREREPGINKLRVYDPSEADHGYRSPHTVIEVVHDDMPFLVDSVRGALERLGVEVQLMAHPIFDVKRDSRGRLEVLAAAGSPPSPSAESIMHVQVTRQPQHDLRALEQALSNVLGDVRRVIGDFDAMLERCRAQTRALAGGAGPNRESARLTAEFLTWLTDDHFTFQGYSYCRFERAPLSSRPADAFGPPASNVPGVRFDQERGLGILRDANRSMFDVFEPPRKRELLRVLKANRHSTVHRTVHLDAVMVSDFDAQGTMQGAHMFVGLFAAAAYAARPASIPILRDKIESVLSRAGFTAGGHNDKMLRHILETYPRDELFQISDADLQSISLGIFHLRYRKRVALFVRRDPFGRFVSCLVYVPRDRMDTALRIRIQEILTEVFHGSLSAYYPQLTDAPLARLHLIIKTPSGTPADLDFAAVERRLELVARSWHDRLNRTLPAELGQARGTLLARRYGNAFPASYREDFDDVAAANDIVLIEDALDIGQLTLQLYRNQGARPKDLRFKIFSPTGYVALSDLLPILENLGLRVLGEVPYEISVEGVDEPFFIHDFALEMSEEAEIESHALQEAFAEVFLATWQGHMADDGFNKLVLRAGLTARQVVLLRAYAKYLRQIRVPFSEAYMQQTLHRNPTITRQLVELFETRFDPDTVDVGDHVEPLVEAFQRSLDDVHSLDQDRILRLFLDVVLATTRTNFYQVDEHGQPRDHLAFKIDSGRIPSVPKPTPFREIFVAGPRVEGVHLRFGEVARGGLRWSDRLEDFRTEILGLAKAQQVKNAVIVPVGSKGGFVVKRPPDDGAGRDALRREGIACYEIFISCLLELTDNRRSVPVDLLESGPASSSGAHDRIEPPPRTRRHDAADPYLVVAADKGTATFSDIANSISESRGFWLEDAFASGGSKGYDHKRMGITARGTWESVKRHFRELGKDVQSEAFTCVGVGDMSGDVFGNGMLLSRHTRLVAAFDHRHVFIDPQPNAETSWQERARLFALDRSSWDDYDRSALSAGGGIFRRSQKRIELSEQARQALSIEAESLTPAELIASLLRAPVELLFFGGIGTYVRASEEPDASVGDRANETLRVLASELSARVIGEGANLALTQEARIEYCLAGGRCNSDFIDNSAGVDCSDHEVNIKILLGDVVRRSGMTRAERNDTLQTMTDEVAALVLRNTYLQTQSLSVSTQLSHPLTDRIARSMRALEKAGQLDRRLESLPDDETLLDRQRAGVGFVRPELCVLMAYAKNSLCEALLSSGLPDDPLLERDLIEYFPRQLQTRFPSAIRTHRLRREITATLITNDAINRLGIAFPHEVREATGASPADLVLAYAAAREILDLRELWLAIEALDNQVPARCQATLLVHCSRLLERVTAWLLREHGGEPAIAQVDTYGPGIRRLRNTLPELLTADEKRSLEQQVSELREQGVPEPLARRTCLLAHLLPAVEVVRVAHLAEVEFDDAAGVYYGLGRTFGFDWLRAAARRLPTLRSWDRQAVLSLQDELFSTQRKLTQAVLSESGAAGEPSRLIEAWAATRQGVRTRCAQLLSEIKTTSNADFAMLTVAARQLEGLLASGPTTLRAEPPPGAKLRAPAAKTA